MHHGQNNYKILGQNANATKRQGTGREADSKQERARHAGQTSMQINHHTMVHHVHHPRQMYGVIWNNAFISKG